MQGKVNSWLALKYQIEVWKIVGLVPAPSDRIKRIFYIFRTFLIHFLGIYCLLLIFIMKTYQADNYSQLLEYLYPPIMVALVALKFFNSLNQRHQLLEMCFVFEKLDARATSPEEIQLIKKAIKSAYKFFLFFLRNMCGGVIVCSLLVAIFSSERDLPYPAWYPWDFTKSRTIYIVTIIHEVSCIVFVVIIETGNSTYPQAYLQVIAAHIKCLKQRVLLLGRLQCNDGIENKNEKEIFHQLTRCIDDHAIILHSYEQIRKILSLPGLGQLGVTACVQCVIAITISSTDVKELSKIMQMLLVGLVTSLQTFILCYSCEMFCKECEELYQAIYGCNWTDQSIRFQKAIMLFLQRAQKIHEIRAGNLIPLNYGTFLSVLKSSYSLFAILNKSGQR